MPFWQQSMERWDGMFTAGLRAHLLTARFALPMMVEADEGLVVLTTFTMGRATWATSSTTLPRTPSAGWRRCGPSE